MTGPAGGCPVQCTPEEGGEKSWEEGEEEEGEEGGDECEKECDDKEGGEEEGGGRRAAPQRPDRDGAHPLHRELRDRRVVATAWRGDSRGPLHPAHSRSAGDAPESRSNHYCSRRFT